MKNGQSSGMNALLVEPKGNNLSGTARQLEELGFDLVSCEGIVEAVDQIEKNLFQIICVSMEGDTARLFDFAKIVRSDKHGHQYIPLIIFNSQDDSIKSKLTEILELGATEVFQKNRSFDFFAYLESFSVTCKTRNKLQGRVLLVEDDEYVSHYISLILESVGLEVFSCAKAEEACDFLRNGDFDLVVTDFVLEGNMSGLGLIQAIRNFKNKKSKMPILAVSSMNDASRRVQLLQAGANDYIGKPVLPEELKARVGNLITNKQLIDKIRIQKKELEKMAMTDHLTGVYNRHALIEMSIKSISEAIRHNFELCLVVADIDHFKAVNDTYGHAIGDLVLKAFSSLVREECRGEDFVARFGGEEFVIVLTHCSIKSAKAKIEIIREKIEKLNPENISITASFGIATLKKETGKFGFDELFNEADKAVYIAKENGRNQVRVI